MHLTPNPLQKYTITIIIIILLLLLLSKYGHSIPDVLLQLCRLHPVCSEPSVFLTLTSEAQTSIYDVLLNKRHHTVVPCYIKHESFFSNYIKYEE